MIEIKLNFINESNDANNSQVVIFQKNISPALVESSVVAWRVFPVNPKGVVHAFAVQMDFMVAASDSFGNVTPQQISVAGSRFNVVSSISGNELKLSSQPASIQSVVEIANELPVGAIEAMVYNDGHLLAKKTGIAPGQNASFLFGPTIYLSLTHDVTEGDIVNPSVPGDNSAQMSLLGISSADIVLSGGGSGSFAKPFLFTLQNVKYS